MSAVIEINYFPSQAFFSLLATKNLLIEHCENYQKRSFRNKCVILGAQGPQMLTVPLLKGKHQKQSIRETKISYSENWGHQHLQALVSAYGKAPYFDHYIDKISILFESKETYLFSFNLKIIKTISELIGLTKPLQLTRKYLASNHYDEDFRDLFNPKNYTSIVFAEDYFQVFADRFDFCKNLSIVDLLFCLGPATMLYLERVTFDKNLLIK